MTRTQGRYRRWGSLAVVLLVTVVFAERGAANEIQVTTTTQKVSSSGGCSLQEAIYSANFDKNIAIDTTNPDHFITTECEAGNGDDTITLPANGVFSMGAILDDAYNYMGPTATPIVFSNITLEASGARLEHSPNGILFRAFAVGSASIDLNPGGTPDVVSGTGNLTIRNAHIKGFAVKGGDGASGGGGGLGAGGAIYVQHGGLTIEYCTFEGNGAAGGNGSFGANAGGGGGGGGLAGNGGYTLGEIEEFFTGSGAGGGGSKGNGGASDADFQFGFIVSGGGGGTVTSGKGSDTGSHAGGFRCGGSGGSFEEDGQNAPCPGGGGGGGGEPNWLLGFRLGGDGGTGGYGGGGAGGGYHNHGCTLIGCPQIEAGSGGHGGFGGGGGAGGGSAVVLDGRDIEVGSGGDGGFGGGGGAGDSAGTGGTFAGDGSLADGGGGAGLGGAIFNHGGTVVIRNSTFTGNFAVRGEGKGTAHNGGDAGGAIFSVAGSLTVIHSTISNNESTGEGAGIVVYKPGDEATSFTLRNTIIANSLPAVRECFFKNSVTAQGSGNLIEANFGCPGMEQTANPQLGPLQLNPPGNTPTMEIPEGSPAVDTADAATSLPTDQRGVARPFGAGPDIGAYERGNSPPVALCKDVTATAGESCTADASVDNGSYDPDTGDSITLEQSPAGPYALGTNSVTLTATDSFGATNTCTATVTVVDDTPPVVSSTVAKSVITPIKNHDLVNVGLAASATDACGAPTSLPVQVFADEDDETPAGDAVFSPDARDIAVGTLRVRAERIDFGDGRVYLLVTRASDSSGNSGFSCRTVVVPRNASAANQAVASSQAAAALSFCQANSGAAPPGYFVIGDGPVIGNKQ